jgi:hypothetical protein
MVGLFRKFIKTTRNLENCITRDIGIVIHKGRGIK